MLDDFYVCGLCGALVAREQEGQHTWFDELVVSQTKENGMTEWLKDS